MTSASKDRGFGLASRDNLIPAAPLRRAPKAIKAANAAALKAFEISDETRTELREAREVAHNAEADDAAALKAALSAGKDEPAPTVATKRDNVIRLEKKLVAAIDVRDSRVTALHQVIAEGVEDWQAAELAALSELAEQAGPAITAAAEAVKRVDQQAGVCRSLHSFTPVGRDGNFTRFNKAGLADRLERTLAGIAGAIRGAAESVTAGDSGMQQHAERVAEQRDRARLREEHLQERNRRAGTTTWIA